MEHDAEIIICGDPIKDIYVEEYLAYNQKVLTEKVVTCSGSALNVYENLKSILREDVVTLVGPTCYQRQDIYSIIRSSFVGRDIYLVPESERSSFYHNAPDPTHSINSSTEIRNDGRPMGLVLSDYNRGLLNRQSYAEPITYPFEFCVVDSKERTINIDLFKSSKLKIWHATGNEYCSEFAKNFDWVYHTNAEGPVLITSGDNDMSLHPIWVPDTKVINTCGAGDTFTAAIASYLTKINQERLTEEDLLQAGAFAIACCQEVITKPYTSITNHKLDETCT